MFCTYCGKQIDDDSIFCRFCGKTLSSRTTSNDNNQAEAMVVKKIVLPNNRDSEEDDSAEPEYDYSSLLEDDSPVYNFVMHFIGPAEPQDCDFSIVKNADEDDDWGEDEEIDEQETTASTVEKTFEYELDEGVYTIYVNSYTREVKIENGKIIDFTFDCSGFFNQIYIKDRSEGADNRNTTSRNADVAKSTVKSNKPGTILFTLHMIGPSKPAQFKYSIVRLNKKQVIDKGSTYAVSTDNKLTYNLTPGMYEVKIDRYTRVVNVGEANDVDFIFDCSHHFNSIQIIGDIKG